jgi:PAS domain S-box-containing protein
MENVFASGLADHVFFRCVEDCFEPIMLTDRTGVLRYVNPAWSLTYGYPKDEAVGMTPRLLRSEFQDDQFYHRMWQTILNPRIGFWRGEVINRAKDGHLVPVILTITPYRAQSGEIVGYMGIAVDLTEQKRMEQQILRQDRLASIGMLAGGLAHEIGNPLGVIRGRAELLMRQVQDNPHASKNLDVIVSQIDRISGLIQSLLRVSRVPEEILLREVHLGSVVSEVATLMSEACRRAGIELRTRSLDHHVMAEPSHLQQLFLNLVINATHAIEDQKSKGAPSRLLKAPEDSHFIEVSASPGKDPSICEIFVRDSGCGIPPANLKKLFQPFFTTKAAGVGTGMGLAIVSKLVEEMKGRVSAESEGPGYGATFKLEFQLAKKSR